MKKTIHNIFIILLLNISTSLFSQTDNVLFIGNSITYFNDMPELFKSISISKGKNVGVTSHTVGGAGFLNHVNDAALFQKIRSKNYKYVVMQPGTGESAGVSNPVILTAERGRIIRDSIKKYSPCSKIFLYEIPYGVPAQNDYATYFAYQKIIKDSITKMSNLMQVEMIPAGEAARAHYTATQDLALHGSYNDIHPGLQGSYLVASTIYATIFQTSVFPSTFYGGLAQDKAEYYQQIAGNTFLNNPAQWNTNIFHLNANFLVTGSGQNIDLQNQSTNYSSVNWNFGDGTVSTATNPTHHYSYPGIYTITLTVNKNLCSETISKQVDTNLLSVTENKTSKFELYPNPVENTAFIKTTKPIKEITVYSMDGRKIRTFPDLNIMNGKIDFSILTKGVYILSIQYKDGGSESIKLIKK
ncbi:PKD domain-containing protein [Chryseobacterium paludis]|uniref:PKD domain-containing protein n=1 Tax=Chryseobacterium paludis TaxID=2956784 RepID=UPI0021C0DAE7|nr:PKD domain-containing protein [Chryseobacterium paludis]